MGEMPVLNSLKVSCNQQFFLRLSTKPVRIKGLRAYTCLVLLLLFVNKGDSEDEC